MSREPRFRAWDGLKFYEPILYQGKVFRSGRDFEDFTPCSDLVEQFTGLVDKNGTEIWEGDIVRINWLDRRYENHIDVVAWRPERACFEFGAGATSEVSWSHEVMGNVHANPELLA